MIGQKSSPGLVLRRARTWGGKATWRKNWTVTCMPLQHATACAWGEKAAAVCARVRLDGGGGGWYRNGEHGWGACRRSSCRASGGAGPDAGQMTGHCSAADPAPFIDRWPRSSSWLCPVARWRISGGACAAAGRYGVCGGAVSEQRTEGAA
jgi:hypothetical protein